mmetsp:Transcript_19214/g.17033  ORF Transcript_19214/g.17033 Transcript_19214/m.17033 type:complete len:308 (-) Transcript_19214:74-997(-)
MFELDKLCLHEHIKFTKDFLYSIYLYEPGFDKILTPICAYQDPETLIYEKLLKPISLYELYNRNDFEYSASEKFAEGFTLKEILEIIYNISLALKHCHDRGILLNNLSFDTIIFENQDLSSLKIMDFHEAFLIEHKQDFIDKVDLNNIDPHIINSLEKILLRNRDDDHRYHSKEENSRLAMKSPEFMMQKDLGPDPQNHYKSDIWSVGIIFHFFLVGVHHYEILLNRELEDISRYDVAAYLKEKEKVDEFDTDADNYKHIPESFKDLLKMCLNFDVEKRATIDEVLQKIKEIQKINIEDIICNKNLD